MNQPTFHQPSIQATSDGSSTLVHPVLDELYHSRHGAWTESHHIFIRHGLMPVIERNPQSISIFEMGFGSGLNATLAHEVANTYEVPVLYVAVELYPVEPDVIRDMVMPDQHSEQKERWLELHMANWDEIVRIDPYFTLHKMKTAFPNEQIPDVGNYDLVFYDAFAPAAQPELWGAEALGKCFELLKEGGSWLSYCAKGQVRRTLKEVGFIVEALPGPPGKREITRAIKKTKSLS